MSNDCTPECSQDCSWIFDRVRVRPTIAFGAYVEWQLHPQFDDPEPYTFTLQVGHTGSNLADDWQDVGLPATDVFYLQDDTQRVYGRTQWTHYRVKLVTSEGTYYSEPMHCWGDVEFRYWRLIHNRERMYRKLFQRTVTGSSGYLLKRKLTGEQPEPGAGIIDYMTGEVVNPDAAETAGTEFIGGYYAPIPCIYADLNSVTRREQLAATRGTVNDGFKTTALMLASPQVDSYDIWVEKDTDLRWELHEIRSKEEIKGVPVTVEAEFRLLPFSHPAYAIEITRD